MSRLTDLIAQAKANDPQMPKLRGLARYAETHPGVYRRIESVAEAGGKLRVLDLTREDVRKAIAAAKDDAASLYGGALASDYK